MVVVASAIVIVVVLVLEFLGRGKRSDCQQRSKIENEDEDDRGGKLYRANGIPGAVAGLCAGSLQLSVADRSAVQNLEIPFPTRTKVSSLLILSLLKLLHSVH